MRGRVGRVRRHLRSTVDRRITTLQRTTLRRGIRLGRTLSGKRIAVSSVSLSVQDKLAPKDVKIDFCKARARRNSRTRVCARLIGSLRRQLGALRRRQRAVRRRRNILTVVGGGFRCFLTYLGRLPSAGTDKVLLEIGNLSMRKALLQSISKGTVRNQGHTVADKGLGLAPRQVTRTPSVLRFRGNVCYTFIRDKMLGKSITACGAGFNIALASGNGHEALSDFVNCGQDSVSNGIICISTPCGICKFDVRCHECLAATTGHRERRTI